MLLGISYFLLMMHRDSGREWNWERCPCFGSILEFTTSHLCCSRRLLSQVTEKLLEVENETMMKVADLEKLLLQKDKDLQVIRVSQQP